MTDRWLPIDDAARQVRVARDRDGVEWVTVAQAAHRLDVKRATIWQWVSRGVIPEADVVRVGRRMAIALPALLHAEWHLRTHGPKLAAGVRRGGIANG